MKNNILVLTLCLCSLSLTAQTRFENIFDTPQIITLNSITKDIDLSCGVAKAAIPVRIPEGAIGWYFTLEILPKSKKPDSSASLLAQLNSQKEPVKPADAANYISVPRTGRECNVYLVQGKENAESFVSFQGTRYLKKIIQTKSRAVYLPHTGEHNLFICLENPYNLRGLNIKVEAVAVFKK